MLPGWLIRQALSVLERLRATGADLPFSDLRRAHGRGMEGYFWRLSDRSSGRVIVALCGVNRDRTGARWANVALAAGPGGFGRQAEPSSAGAAADRYAVWAGPDGSVLRADAESLSVELGPDARLQVGFTAPRSWSRPGLGGIGAGHLVPGLGQYWHPHLLGATVRGSARLGGETVCLDGWSAYGEHTWSSGGAGFPPRWWWGQAQGFPDPEVCVAFAGGEVSLGPLRTSASAVVVALPGRRIALNNPLIAPVQVDTGPGYWHLRGRGPRFSVELDGHAPPGSAHRLAIPLPAERRTVPGALEHLVADLSLTVRRRGQIIYRGRSAVAGLEIGGHGAAEAERSGAQYT